MALLTKNKVNQFGVQEEYWRILAIHLNLQYQYCDITLGAYADKDARLSDAEPMNTKKVRAKWSEEEFTRYFSPFSRTLLNEGIYNNAYDYVKQKDKYFKNATDC